MKSPRESVCSPPGSPFEHEAEEDKGVIKKVIALGLKVVGPFVVSISQRNRFFEGDAKRANSRFAGDRSFAEEGIIVSALGADEDHLAADLHGTKRAPGSTDKHLAAKGIAFLEPEDTHSGLCADTKKTRSINDRNLSLSVGINPREGWIAEDISHVGIDN